MINRVVLLGRLTKDPEIRKTNNGKSVTTFTLALNRFNEGADFVRCQCWDKLAENVERYCSKGSLVAVEGQLRSGSYQNNQGQKISTLDVLCSSVQFVDTKPNNNQNNQNNQFDSSFDSFKIDEDYLQF